MAGATSAACSDLSANVAFSDRRCNAGTDDCLNHTCMRVTVSRCAGISAGRYVGYPRFGYVWKLVDPRTVALSMCKFVGMHAVVVFDAKLANVRVELANMYM